MFIDIPAPVLKKGDGSYPPICADDDFFLITKENFDKLPEYNTSCPSGVYEGKCWKVKPHPDNPDQTIRIRFYLTPPGYDKIYVHFKEAVIV